MLAANVWYWWVGILLTAVAVLAVIGLIVGYLKSVTAQRYPDRRHQVDSAAPSASADRVA